MSPAPSRITDLLRDMGAHGLKDAASSERLLEALYPELRRLAARLLRRERPGHTLPPTALVHEAYLELVDQTQVSFQDRAHFFGIAARVMRQVLVDHARRRRAAKRGGSDVRVTLDENVLQDHGPALDVLDLHQALDRLADVDERGARVVELRAFAGLGLEEIAQVLGVSKRTVDGDWALAKMWLARALDRGGAG